MLFCIRAFASFWSGWVGLGWLGCVRWVGLCSMGWLFGLMGRLFGTDGMGWGVFRLYRMLGIVGVDGYGGSWVLGWGFGRLGWRLFCLVRSGVGKVGWDWDGAVSYLGGCF